MFRLTFCCKGSNLFLYYQILCQLFSVFYLFYPTKDSKDLPDNHQKVDLHCQCSCIMPFLFPLFVRVFPLFTNPDKGDTIREGIGYVKDMGDDLLALGLI